MTAPTEGDDFSPDVEPERDISAALRRRVTIGQAQGILMERLGMSEDEAFAFLARRSQERNVKLHKLASEVVRSRELP